MGVPDDWGCYYRTCDECGKRYHASEGGCSCEEDNFEFHRVTKVVTARRARFEGTAGEIRPGDLVERTTGFEYRPGGPRTRYLKARYVRIEKGPAWPKTVEQECYPDVDEAIEARMLGAQG